MELAKYVWIHEEGSRHPGNPVVRIDTSVQSENFTAPSAAQVAKGANSIAADHGTSGPVQVSFPTAMFGGNQQISFVNATNNLFGLVYSPDLSTGSPNCVSLVPLVRIKIHGNLGSR